MDRTQAHRTMAVVTPLGDDVLLLRSVIGSEHLGRGFEYELVMTSEQSEIDVNGLIGGNVTVRLETSSGQTRYFNGFVNGFTRTPGAGRMFEYRATVVPWSWFLTRTADCRIFQNMKVPDIIMKVFRDHGFTDFKDKLSESYREWEYCVQYRETDFNFVSRLMEQEGIYYFFEHENGKHTMVLVDSATAHQPYPDYEQIKYNAVEEAHYTGERISDWVVEITVQPGSYALNDFNFKNPKNDLQSRSMIQREHSQSEFEIYDYPGEYTDLSEGENYCKRRIEQMHTDYEVIRADSDVRGISVGYTFDLIDHPQADQNRQYLITSATYQLDSDEYSPGDGGSEEVFSCNFSAIDANQSFRSARTTPKPLIQGVQTAIVVGPSGEEIHTDEYGRVKVQFHWDRYGKADENSSCWIRVSQSWAGKNWGAMIIPRIGQEVIVEFLEGDPDRPIITGRVYNADNMPPYELPDNKTMSTMKSNSSKEGQGFNEIRFEDKTDEEQIFIHAQKNQDVRVKNDSFEWVGNNRHLVVKKDQTEHVENNRNEKVDADHKEEIGKDRHLKVKGKEAKAVDGSLSLTVGDDVIEVFKKNHSEETTKDYYLKADNIIIEGMTNVTVKVGDSFIAIESGGIKIGTSGDIVLEASGNVEQTAMGDVSLEATGNASVKGTSGLALESTAQAELKSPLTTVKGDGTLTLKGGVVLIN